MPSRDPSQYGNSSPTRPRRWGRSSACSAGEPSHVLQALGLSRQQAAASLRFGLGRHTSGAEIAAAVTAANPPPVALKLEKVYRPCVLLSKKRYVGAMHESPGQAVPSFDAKGIETVRRDNCGLVRTMVDTCLKTILMDRDTKAAADAAVAGLAANQIVEIHADETRNGLRKLRLAL